MIAVLGQQTTSISGQDRLAATVDNEIYRWIISPNDGYLTFIAESWDFQGRKLEVYIKSDINKLWVKFPDIEDLNMKIIKPKDASSIISQANKKGWNPREKGSPIVFDLIGEILKKR